MSQEAFNSESITWFIDREPDYNIIDNYSINNQDDSNNESNQRYFENLYDYNTPNSSNMPLSTNTTNFNLNDDFIPFDNNIKKTSNIKIYVNQFIVSEENKTCCICLELRETNEICRLNCQHLYCIKCINQHLQTNHLCPLCRTQINLIQTQNNNDEFKNL